MIAIRGCGDTGTGLSGFTMMRLRRERNSGMGLLGSGKLENDELCALLIGFDLSLVSAIYTCCTIKYVKVGQIHSVHIS